MQISKLFRRAVATVIVTAGLAYPACAAVCPKGIGGCTSPGRCFLFVDADGNSLCDYTSRIATSGTVSSPTTTPAQVSGSSGSTAAPRGGYGNYGCKRNGSRQCVRVGNPCDPGL